MYNQDSDDTFPAVRVAAAAGWAAPNGDTATPAWVPWLCSVGPYIKNSQIFNCPSAGVRWDGGATGSVAGDKFSNIGYGYNEYFAAWRYQLSGGYYVPIPSAMVLKPAETMCLIEKGTTARYFIDTRVTYVWSRPGIPSDSLAQDGRLDVA
jgi:hypothetical protein